MAEKKNVPEIRFPGFTAAWEQRKLTEFVEFFSGLTYTPNDVQENGTLVLRSSNVSNGEVVDVDNVYVNPQVVNSENVKVGDIVVVVRNGSRSLIGKHAQIKAFMPNTVIGAFMTGIRSECPEFTNALLNTSRFEEEIAMNMGATINQITGYMFSKMEFKVPCLDEQKKIGEYFEKLDNLITLHQRKLEHIKYFKKYCLQKMFPKKGEQYPEIRFPEFTATWEQRKLIEVCDYVDYRGKTPCKTESGIFLVTAKNVKAGYIDYACSKEYISENDYEEVMHRGKPEIGDVLITTEAPCGNVAQVNKPNIALAQRIIKYRGHNKVVDNTYLKHYLLSPFFQSILNEKSSGGTVQGIKGSVLHQQLISYPNYEEQQKVGTYFDNLDNLITLHQRELDNLKKLKKACLQKMFV